MKCSFCRNKSVYFRKNEGHHYCRNHFIKNIEKRVKRTIRANKLIENGDRIAVAVSGGKDSANVLFLLKKIFKNNPKIELFTIILDEGIKRYRYLLDKKVRELKATKLAIGWNLDDECQDILMNVLKGGLLRDFTVHKKFVPIIKPLITIPGNESELYAKLNNIPFHSKKCNFSVDNTLRKQARKFLNNLEETSPGIKYSLFESSRKIMPFVRAKLKPNQEVLKVRKLLKSVK